MTEETTRPATPPAGYWLDANDNLVPISKIKDIDKDRTRVVTQLCEQAMKASADLLAFKLTAMDAITEFVQRSLADYDAKLGGKKGNVTLTSFDGKWKIVRSNAETLMFDERLQAAQALIAECVVTWSKGSGAEIKALINQAFQTDQAGKINTARVLSLRSLKINDEKWLRAMTAISDSTKAVSTKAYIRFYVRQEAGTEYVAIPLDVAAI